MLLKDSDVLRSGTTLIRFTIVIGAKRGNLHQSDEIASSSGYRRIPRNDTQITLDYCYNGLTRPVLFLLCHPNLPARLGRDLGSILIDSCLRRNDKRVLPAANPVTSRTQTLLKMIQLIIHFKFPLRLL